MLGTITRVMTAGIETLMQKVRGTMKWDNFPALIDNLLENDNLLRR
jgi:hypothetical protein